MGEDDAHKRWLLFGSPSNDKPTLEQAAEWARDALRGAADPARRCGESVALTAELVKESQNLTYFIRVVTSANESDQAQVAGSGADDIITVLRVTPQAHLPLSQVQSEVALLDFVRGANPAVSVCEALAPPVTRDGNTVVAFRYASGSPVGTNWSEWNTDTELFRAWGKWLGGLHVTAVDFWADPQRRGEFDRPHWDEVHHGLLARVDEVFAGPLAAHEQEAELDFAQVDECGAAAWKSIRSWLDNYAATHPRDDPAVYGPLHGDLIVGNFNRAPGGGLDVFDWDQLQLGWYLLDVAVPLWSAFYLSSALGAVTGVDYEVFREHFLAGYQAVRPLSAADHAAIDQFVELRKLFYVAFCRKAHRDLILYPGEQRAFPTFKAMAESVLGFYLKLQAQQQEAAAAAEPA